MLSCCRLPHWCQLSASHDCTTVMCCVGSVQLWPCRRHRPCGRVLERSSRWVHHCHYHHRRWRPMARHIRKLPDGQKDHREEGGEGEDIAQGRCPGIQAVVAAQLVFYYSRPLYCQRAACQWPPCTAIVQSLSEAAPPDSVAVGRTASRRAAGWRCPASLSLGARTRAGILAYFNGQVRRAP